MKKIKALLCGCAAVFLALLWSCGNSSDITLLSYNVENLFDDVDNGTEYKEYDPSSRQWNRELMEIKLTNIAKVIRGSAPGGPDIVCLQEVENRHVLDLLADEHLGDLGYRFRYVDDSGRSPTNAALLSRYPVSRTHLYGVPDWNGQALRSILEVEIHAGAGALHIFNNHWKSKTGGARRSEPARLRTVGILLARLKILETADPHADIIILGDLNESCNEYLEAKGAYQTALIPADAVVPEAFYLNTLFLTDNPPGAGAVEDQRNPGAAGKTQGAGAAEDQRNPGAADGKLIFYDCWYSLAPEQRGSYVYRKQWQTLDHMLLSAGLFDDMGFFMIRNGFSVVRLSFMLDERTGFPLRWKVKARNKGYSDHLPLLLKLGTARTH
jgi:endonuclease/exonuclease/phosphatase family metal-dependent hydrolase